MTAVAVSSSPHMIETIAAYAVSLRLLPRHLWSIFSLATLWAQFPFL